MKPLQPARTAAAPQEVRLIGGRWKRTPLPVLQRPGLRPTPARVREFLKVLMKTFAKVPGMKLASVRPSDPS